MKFKIGDLVKWTSQAQGSTTEKVGEVCLVVGAMESQRSAMSRLEKEIGVGVISFLKLGGSEYLRYHESYFVKVAAGKKAMPQIYHPKVTVLKAAN